MRGLGSWCTTHRKTVILAWVVALIGVGFAAGSVGSAFSENFELPSSDSQRAVELLEKRFPAQSGETTTIVYRASAGVESSWLARILPRLHVEPQNGVRPSGEPALGESEG